MTAAEHIYAIKERIATKEISQDFRFNDMFIYHYLKAARLALLKKYKSYEKTSSTICIDLIKKGLTDCDINDCDFTRSLYKIPSYIGKINIIDFEGNSINQKNIKTFKLNKFSLTNKDAITFDIINSYIYILNTTTLEKVILKGIFEDPCNIKDNCDLNIEFPFDGEYILEMYDVVISKLFNANTDKENDRTDQTISTNQQVQ